MNIRPSNIVRGIENIAIGTSKLVATGASIVADEASSRFAEVSRNFRIEYAARKLMALRTGIEDAVAEIEAMTPEQRVQHAQDSVRVHARMEELVEIERLRRVAKDAKRRAKLFR